jgi:hypothetical protein
VRDTLRQFGLGLTLLYLAHRLLAGLSRGRARITPYAFYAQPIGAGLYTNVRESADTVITEVGAEDPLAQSFPRPAPVLAERWRQGSRCQAVLVKGEFGGYIWYSRRYHDEDEVRSRYVLPDDGTSVWDFDVYVVPRLRLGRTLGRLWKAVDARLAAEGMHWSFSRISLFNPASRSTHERLGARCVGHAVYLVVGDVQLAWCSHSPRWTLSFGARPGPQIRLSYP